MAEGQRMWADLADGELVSVFKQRGVDAAFAELVKRYQTRLYRVLIGMVGDTSLAEELCQRVFVKAALRMEQLRDGQAFYGWLLAISRGTALDELRRPARKAEDVDDPSIDRPNSAAAPEHELKQSVRAILAQLSTDDCAALLLSDLEQMSMNEISDALGIGVSAAKMRVKRARERFRELYEEQTT